MVLYYKPNFESCYLPSVIIFSVEDTLDVVSLTLEDTRVECMLFVFAVDSVGVVFPCDETTVAMVVFSILLVVAGSEIDIIEIL